MLASVYGARAHRGYARTMDEDSSEDDAQLARVMTQAARRILAGDRAYDVWLDAGGPLSELICKAHHDGAAYVLWASVSDLLDSPWGPLSESACNQMAAAVAEDWLSVDTGTPESVAAYFERWDPANGSAWLAEEGRILATRRPGVMIDPWDDIDEATARTLEHELRLELPAAHPLAGTSAIAIARRQDRDDVLFELDDGGFAVVHLTLKRASETDARWPRATIFRSRAALDAQLQQDAVEFGP